MSIYSTFTAPPLRLEQPPSCPNIVRLTSGGWSAPRGSAGGGGILDEPSTNSWLNVASTTTCRTSASIHGHDALVDDSSNRKFLRRPLLNQESRWPPPRPCPCPSSPPRPRRLPARASRPAAERMMPGALQRVQSGFGGFFVLLRPWFRRGCEVTLAEPQKKLRDGS